MTERTRQGRMMATWKAMQRHRKHQARTAVSKRTVKSAGLGKGLQKPKNFKVVPQVDLNWHFPDYQRL